MLTIDYKNIFNIGKEAIAQNDWQNTAARLPGYLKNIRARGQGFYACLDDAAEVKNILAYARTQKNKWTSVVALGIGGSALGALCLEQSLTHLFAHELKKRPAPKLYVLDNVDPTLIREVADVLDFKKTLFIVTTKSGATLETLTQYFYFRKKIDALKLKAQKHFVFVTDARDGLLRKIATQEKIPSFAIPANVGGRFSVLTAVGLLPAALIGIDVKKLLTGAKAMRERFLSPIFSQNMPFQLSAGQYLLSQKGKTISVLMPYAQKLIRFADWYRQLLAESLGKAKDNQGRIVHVGLTPVRALGVTDQHSQLQLYSEGPNDKLIMFIRVSKLGKKLADFNKLIDGEYRGTAEALTQSNRPNLTITINKIEAESLGELIMLFEGATAFLGEFFNINAFDQPGVELSKQLTKQVLRTRKQ